MSHHRIGPHHGHKNQCIQEHDELDEYQAHQRHDVDGDQDCKYDVGGHDKVAQDHDHKHWYIQELDALIEYQRNQQDVADFDLDFTHGTRQQTRVVAVECPSAPAGHRVSPAELFYLFHVRSCAAQATGARATTSSPGSVPLQYAPWPQAPTGVNRVLEYVHRALTCTPSALVLFAAWAPLLTGGVSIAILAQNLAGPVLQGPVHPALVLVAACMSATPLEFLCYGACVHGGLWQITVASTCAVALGSDFHVDRPVCRALTLGATWILSPGTYATMTPAMALGHCVLTARAVLSPAFPAAAPPQDQPQEQGGPPPPPQSPHPQPRPPTGRDALVTTWAVDVMSSRRGCLCRSSQCRGPIEKGELRAFSPALANPVYFHLRCIEGGLGPYEQVQGTAALTPAQDDETRDCCDRPGRPTRAEYVEDVRRAKRAKVDPEAQRQAAALGVPLLQADDGDPGRPPGGGN